MFCHIKKRSHEKIVWNVAPKDVAQGRGIGVIAVNADYQRVIGKVTVFLLVPSVP